MKIGILISGRGSNMESIIKATQTGRLSHIKVGAVLSDNAHAEGLEVAARMQVPCRYIFPGKYPTKLDEDAEMHYIEALKKREVDLVCLAGFMRLLSQTFMDAFEGKVLNIHPSLLPKYRGLNAQKRALESGDKVTGCTIHWVDKGMDTGEIIAQKVIPIYKNDSVTSLKKRLLKVEHQLYIDVLDKMSTWLH